MTHMIDNCIPSTPRNLVCKLIDILGSAIICHIQFPEKSLLYDS